MTIRRSKLRVAILLVSFIPLVVGAEEPSADAAGVLEVPNSPAFEALNVSPTKVLRPTTVKEFAFDVSSAIGANGPKPAFAIEFAPIWWWFVGKNTTLSQWRQNYSARFWSRMTISLATTSRDHNAVAIAEGLRIVLVDDFDPRWSTELETCVRNALQEAVRKLGPPADPRKAATEGAATMPATIDAVAECTKKHVADQRKSEGWQAAIAFAPVERTSASDGSVPGGWESFNAWSAISYGWTQRTLALLTARWSRDVNANKNTFTPAARLKLGDENQSFSLEAGWSLIRDAGCNLSNGVELAALYEQRLAATVFLDVKAGGTIGTLSPGADRISTSIALKFDTSSIPLFSYKK